MDLVFWALVACVASYVAGHVRKVNVARDEAFLRLESRALTAEHCLVQSRSEASNWRAAFVESERQLDEAKARLTKLAGCFREQVCLNGALICRVHGIGSSPN